MTTKTRSEKDKEQDAERNKAVDLFEQIAQAQDREFEDVTIPEWGGATVRVVALSGIARDAMDREAWELVQAGKEGDHLHNIRARNLSHSVVHPETGRRIFDTPDKVKALGEKNSSVLARLHAIHDRLNKTIVDAEAEGKNS